MQQYQIEQAKQIVTTVYLEILRDILTQEDLKRYDSMFHIEHMRSHYFDNSGVF